MGVKRESRLPGFRFCERNHILSLWWFETIGSLIRTFICLTVMVPDTGELRLCKGIAVNLRSNIIANASTVGVVSSQLCTGLVPQNSNSAKVASGAGCL